MPVHATGPDAVPADAGDAPETAEHYRRQLRTVAENATLALFIMDEQQRCTYMNPAAERLTGFSLAELQGKALHYYVHHTRPDGTPYPLEECPIDQAFPQNMRERGEEVFVHKDGHFYPVAFTASPVREAGRTVGTIIEARDITEERRERAERQQLVEALESERHRLAAIIEQAPALISVLRGPEHVVELTNPGYAQVIGHRDIVGRRVADSIPEAAEQGFVEILDGVYRTGQPFVGDGVRILLQRVPGAAPEERFFNIVYQPLRDADGVVTGILSHSVDVTEQVRARREVELKAAELARTAAALEASNRELDQFAYVASHDLKAPLRGIANLAEWIEEDIGERLTGESAEHMRLLKGRVHRMDALIDGILAYSRAGRERNPAERVDTGALAREAVELLGVGPDAAVELQPGMPTVQAERVPLQQLFLNLVGNAVKYTRSTRPDVRVRVGWRRVDGAHEFRVADNGPGIPAEFHDRVWGIFQTLQPRDRVESTGIGLSVVKKIVEARGGRVWIESAPGEGATFCFTWPDAAPPGPATSLS